MRIFVTGATGFVGRVVVKYLCASGHAILASTLEKDANESGAEGVRWLYGGLEDICALKPVIKSFEPETVIHLAWQGIPDYSEVISRVNLNNSIQLLDFILEETNCRKIIVSGSCLEYGKDKGVCRETDAVEFKSFFAWAKYSLWRYLLLKCGRKGVSLVWFRIFYVYGPGQRAGSLIPILASALGEGKIPDIRYPLNKNDFIYIEDIAEAFRLAVEKDIATGAYNLGYGAARSVYEACRIVEKALRGSSEISNRILKEGRKEKRLDFSSSMVKTIKVFNWRPRITLEKGIAKYAESLGQGR